MHLLELFEQITSRRVKHMEREFSCGSCMYLALVLNAKYNWPLVGFLSYDDADELEGIIHIWVEPPGTQKAVDIYGVHDVGKFTKELEETSKLYGGEYEHDISPELIKRFIWSGQVYYPRKDRMFYDDRMFYGDEPHPQRKTQQEKFHKQALKQAYRAMQDYLIPQMKEQGLLEHESLVEGEAIREYDPGVMEWLKEALKRPDAKSMASQLIDSKVARKFAFIAMAIKMHKDESIMVDVIERAADEFVDRVEGGDYATLEDAEHDRDIILDMIRLLSDKLYLHDEIRQNSKTAQLLAGRLDLARIGTKWPDLEPESGPEADKVPTLS